MCWHKNWDKRAISGTKVVNCDKFGYGDERRLPQSGCKSLLDNHVRRYSLTFMFTNVRRLLLNIYMDSRFCDPLNTNPPSPYIHTGMPSSMDLLHSQLPVLWIIKFYEDQISVCLINMTSLDLSISSAWLFHCSKGSDCKIWSLIFIFLPSSTVVKFLAGNF